MNEATRADLIATVMACYSAEPRPEGPATAQAFREAARGQLQSLCAPAPLDSEIRALAATSAHPAARAVLAVQDLIPWENNPVAAQMDPTYASMISVAPLLGPDGPCHCDSYRLGLFYQRPNSYYALHAHNAAETYILLAGSAFWTAGPDQRQRGVGNVIHHPSLMSHAFRTGPEGLLALWRWSGDISVSSYVMLDDPAAAGRAERQQ